MVSSSHNFDPVYPPLSGTPRPLKGGLLSSYSGMVFNSGKCNPLQSK